MKSFIRRANGWQRLWVVSTAVCCFYFVVVWPLQEMGKGDTFRYQIKWAIEEEMKNPECALYMSAPLRLLAKPEYSPDGKIGCYNIYMYRDSVEGHAPISPSGYLNEFKREQGETWIALIGIGLLIAIALSGFAYGVGVVIAWVVGGF